MLHRGRLSSGLEQEVGDVQPKRRRLRIPLERFHQGAKQGGVCRHANQNIAAGRLRRARSAGRTRAVR